MWGKWGYVVVAGDAPESRASLHSQPSESSGRTVTVGLGGRPELPLRHSSNGDVAALGKPFQCCRDIIHLREQRRALEALPRIACPEGGCAAALYPAPHRLRRRQAIIGSHQPEHGERMGADTETIASARSIVSPGISTSHGRP